MVPFAEANRDHCARIEPQRFLSTGGVQARQYTRPTGLFYGGEGPPAGPNTMRARLDCASTFPPVPAPGVLGQSTPAWTSACYGESDLPDEFAKGFSARRCIAGDPDFKIKTGYTVGEPTGKVSSRKVVRPESRQSGGPLLSAAVSRGFGAALMIWIRLEDLLTLEFAPPQSLE